MTERFQRNILLYKNYFGDFYNKQPKEVQKKIDETIGLVQELKIIPEKIFKQLDCTDGLFEINIKHGIKGFQIFCFLDGGDIIILQMGFRKGLKRQRDVEIEKAKKLRKEYYFEKANG